MQKILWYKSDCNQFAVELWRNGSLWVKNGARRSAGSYAACCSAMAYSEIMGKKRALQDAKRTAIVSPKIKTTKILSVNIKNGGFFIEKCKTSSGKLSQGRKNA